MISSISAPMCNRFHAIPANIGTSPLLKGGYSFLTPACAGFLEPRRWRLKLLKSTLSA